jgi:hypothetical protein
VSAHIKHYTTTNEQNLQKNLVTPTGLFGWLEGGGPSKDFSLEKFLGEEFETGPKHPEDEPGFFGDFVGK